MKLKNNIASILLFFLFIQCYSIKGQTNVYHPFPDSNAVWGMSAGCTDVNCGDYAYIKYYYEGDTIIEGFDYKKVVCEFLPLTSGNCCIVPGGLGAGCLRQDTVAKKVYWRDQWMNTDTLWYDFSLNVGDTLNSFLNDPWNPKTVLSIDSVLVGESFRKRFNIDTSIFRNEYTYSIIEGIGGTDGFSGYHENNAWQFGSSLTCFSENGNIIYTPQNNPDTIPCGELPVGIKDLYQQSAEIVSVFPIPSLAGNLVRISGIPATVDEPATIEVFDLTGRRLISAATKQTDFIFYAPEKQGVYFVIVSNSMFKKTLKMVVR